MEGNLPQIHHTTKKEEKCLDNETNPWASLICMEISVTITYEKSRISVDDLHHFPHLEKVFTTCFMDHPERIMIGA